MTTPNMGLQEADDFAPAFYSENFQVNDILLHAPL